MQWVKVSYNGYRPFVMLVLMESVFTLVNNANPMHKFETKNTFCSSCAYAYEQVKTSLYGSILHELSLNGKCIQRMKEFQLLFLKLRSLVYTSVHLTTHPAICSSLYSFIHLWIYSTLYTSVHLLSQFLNFFLFIRNSFYVFR